MSELWKDKCSPASPFYIGKLGTSPAKILPLVGSAVRHLISSWLWKRTQRATPLEAPRPKACSRLLERDNADYLHGGEVPWSVKLEFHFNRARAEALVLPANVVIAWPHTVLVALCEIIQS